MAEGGPRDVIDVEALHLFLVRGLPADGAIGHHRAYVRNIAYSLQYIDHLLGELEAGTLRRTLHSQACKSVVVVGMGIVEAVLWYVLRKRSAARTRDWEEVRRLSSNPFSDFGGTHRIVTVVERQLSQPALEEMSLDSMVKRAERRSLLGSLDHAVYGHLNVLRRLRNRVHIHAVEGDDDTDWHSFTGREVKLMIDALRSVLCLGMFSPTPDHLGLLSFLDAARVERRA